MADSKRVAAALKSGLTGGAATGRGVNYQSLYATYLALKLITKLLREAPTERPMLAIEPRIVSDTGAGPDVTRWDIQVSGAEHFASEAKAKATKRLFILRRQETETAPDRKRQLQTGQS